MALQSPAPSLYDSEQQRSPAILCLNRDPTALRKSLAAQRGWKAEKEATGIFFQLSIHKFAKSISGKASFILNEDGEAVVSPCWCWRTGPRVYLVVNQSSPSSLDTKCPGSALLFTTEGSREVTLGQVNGIISPVQGWRMRPVLIHRFQNSAVICIGNLILSSLKLCFSLNLVEFHAVSNISGFLFEQPLAFIRHIQALNVL